MMKPVVSDNDIRLNVLIFGCLQVVGVLPAILLSYAGSLIDLKVVNNDVLMAISVVVLLAVLAVFYTAICINSDLVNVSWTNYYVILAFGGFMLGFLKVPATTYILTLISMTLLVMMVLGTCYPKLIEGLKGTLFTSWAVFLVGMWGRELLSSSVLGFGYPLSPGEWLVTFLVSAYVVYMWSRALRVAYEHCFKIPCTVIHPMLKLPE